MNELFMKIGTENVPISEDMINKYNLKKGMKSPFTNFQIVDMNGDFTPEHQDKNAKIADVEEAQIIYTKSEILG